MTSILKSALGQAVREILAEHSSENRFGITLTPQDVEQVSTRIAELFETSLDLRSRFGGGLHATEQESETPTASRARGGALPTRQEPAPPALPSSTLPRKRTAMTDAERERLRRG